MKVLVLGGAGFVGRHVAAELLARGRRVVIGTRRPGRAGRRLTATAVRCERREVHFERLAAAESWPPLLAGVDVVVNCVGILRERGAETYDSVHHRAPAALASACARSGARLIHVSALGLHEGARSGFITSKLAGERAVAASGADYLIVRPSLLDGEGGFGARWLRWLARWPVHLVPADAIGRIAALHVHDLGEAIAVLCESGANLCGREVEVGGSESWTMAEYLAVLRSERSTRPVMSVAVPPWLARIASHLCDAAHFSPFSFGHLELMRRDNAPRANALPALLGRAPTPLADRARKHSAVGQVTPAPPGLR
ncbi:MAG TPA: NAD-dependent epimerase/dehydratase family protein [Burkholderiales bacterium]|nr:NAD-dependent epimerase/dehydratase family protein [Burkholderiales bacterium]